MTQNGNDGYGQVDWNRQNDWNRRLIEEFHANGGDVSGPMAGTPLLLLTTTGAKSGQIRTSPLVYYDENGRLFVFILTHSWGVSRKVDEIGMRSYERIFDSFCKLLCLC